MSVGKKGVSTGSIIIVASLTEKKLEEKDSDIFTSMQCSHYMEVANLMLNQ